MDFVTAVLGLAIVAFVLIEKERFFSAGSTVRSGQIIERYARDLTALAARDAMDPVIGRNDEIRRVIQTLGRRGKDNVVLVGPAGVGKTAIAEGLAEAIVAGRVPPSLQGKRVLALDLNSLVAGTKYRGEFESRIMRLSDEIIAARRNIILFIDEIHTLTEAGEASGAISAGDILKPALARGDLQVVGATTPMEYEKYIREDTTLARRLQPILVREPSKEETLQILKGIKDRYESHHGVVILDEALEACVELADKYVPGRVFPDKAIDLMDESASRVKLQYLGLDQGKVPPKVTRASVEEVVTDETPFAVN